MTDGDHGSARTPRLAGLDGLRAIAVTAVVFYHSDFRWARGGYLGVDLFFVISGFLITQLLAREVDETGGVNISGFYWRRAKRLLPASWLMTAAVIAAAWLAAPDALARLRGDSLASFFYVTNWELLFAKVSYFESIGRPPLLLHLWSLAIEEQFYILWAPFLLLGLRFAGRRRLLLYAGVGAALLVAWSAFLANRGGYLVETTPTRLDFGTDTHSFPLLIGAILGLAWRPEPQSGAEDGHAGHGVFTLGLLALGGLIFAFLRLGEETPELYPWGFLATALLSAAVIAAATFGGSYFGRWLDQQPLRWLGERSYGVYLWHWPIFMLVRPEDIHAGPVLTFAVRVALTLLVSELSYRFVETPIRQGLIERIWAGATTPGRRLGAFGYGAAVVAGLALLLTPMVNLWRADAAAFTLASASARPAPPKPKAEPAAAPRPRIAPPLKLDAAAEVTALGDSVLIGSSPDLKRALPGVRVYAHVGWQARDLIDQLRTLRRANALAPVVLIHLGTNGYVYEPQLREMLGMLADRTRVVLVNCHAPRRWVEPNNELLDRAPQAFPNVVLVDWRKSSDGHGDYFVADGFHLTPSGRAVFVSEILRQGHLAPTGYDPAPPAAE